MIERAHEISGSEAGIARSAEVAHARSIGELLRRGAHRDERSALGIGELNIMAAAADSPNNMSMSRRDWTLWVLVTLATVPASFSVWLVGAVGMCAEEDGFRPHAALGDSLCGSLVKPVVPWAVLALIPTVLAGIGTFVAIRRRDLKLAWMLFGGAYLLAFVIGLVFLSTF